MVIKVNRGSSLITSIKPDSAKLSKGLSGQKEITVSFELSSAFDFSLGDYISYNSETYYLNSIPSVVKNSSVRYDYTAVFEAKYYDLSKVQFLFEGLSDFYFNGTLRNIVDIMIDNIDRVYGPDHITIDEVDDTEYKNLYFNGENCMDVLGRIASEWEVEYFFENDSLYLSSTIGTDTGDTYEYGKSKGLYSISRNVVPSKNIITRLYALGSERNIEYDYRVTTFNSKNLLKRAGVIDLIDAVDINGYATKTYLGNGKWKFASDTTHESIIRLYVAEADLLDNATYFASVFFESASGVNTIDWCDGASGPITGTSGRAYASHSRVYDSTYRYMDVHIPANGYVTLFNAQVEQNDTEITSYEGGYSKTSGRYNKRLIFNRSANEIQQAGNCDDLGNWDSSTGATLAVPALFKDRSINVGSTAVTYIDLLGTGMPDTNGQNLFVSFYFKADSLGDKGRVTIQSATNIDSSGSGTDWERVGGKIVWDTAGADDFLRLLTTTAGYTGNFDGVMVLQITATEALLTVDELLEKYPYSDDVDILVPYVQENTDIYGVIESTKVFDDIYPHRTGSVTTLVSEIEFLDSGMDFDLNNYLLSGITAKVHFNNGNLAGYEFEVEIYEHTGNASGDRYFKIIQNQDEQGYQLPTTLFTLTEGDEYVLLDINLPDSYVEAAEDDLIEAAEDHLSQNSSPRVSYDIELDPIYIKENSITFEIGDSVTIHDADLSIDRLIRIINIEEDIVTGNVDLTLSDELEPRLISRVSAGEEQRKQIEIIQKVTNVPTARSGYKSVSELQSMVYDIDNYFDTGNIRPLSIETSMLSVGTKSQSFILESEIDANPGADITKFEATAGTLVHLTIAETNQTWVIYANSQTGLVAGTSYYLYAHLKKDTLDFASNKIEADSSQRDLDDGTYYNFLIGILHSAVGGVRSISLTYGMTTINGKFITTGKIQDSTGLIYFDLDSGIIETTKAGINGAGSGDSEIRIWAGDTYANRATAPFRIQEDGTVYSTKAYISAEDGDGYKVELDGGHISIYDTTPVVVGSLRADALNSSAELYLKNVSDEEMYLRADKLMFGLDTVISWFDDTEGSKGLELNYPVKATDLPTKTSETDIIYIDGSGNLAVGSVPSGGFGNVSNSGTPLVNEVAVWVDATTIKGDSNLKWIGTEFNITGDLALSGDLSLSDIDSVDSIQFNINAGITVGEGQLAWNLDEDTLDIGGIGVTYQVGQELMPLYKNQTGATITNGTPVMYAGALGASGRVLIMPAIADGTYLPGQILGVTTQDIANGADGHVTWFGKVRDIDTTGTPYGETWVDGDLVYVSPITAGHLTNVEPNAPNLNISIGAVINTHATNGCLAVRPVWRTCITCLNDVNGTPLITDGQIMVWDNVNQYFDFTSNISDFLLDTPDVIKDTHIDWGTGANQVSAVDVPVADTENYYLGSDIETILSEIGETRAENGWDLLNPDTMSDISFENSTRTFTASVKAGQSNFSFWVDSKKFTKTTSQNVVIPNVTDTYYIVFNNSGVLEYVAVSEISSIHFYENAITGIIYWNATAGTSMVGNEQHGKLMDARTHHSKHSTLGALYESGMDITGLSNGGTTYSNTTSGYFWDEDIRHVISTLTTAPFIYRLGTAGEWTGTTPDNLVAYKDGADTYFSWNEWTGIVWQLTEGTPLLDYWIIFYIGTPDINGYSVKKIIGHNAYKSALIARNAIETERNNLALEGLPSPEFIFLYATIVDRDGTTQAIDASGNLYLDLRAEKGGTGSTSATASIAANVVVDASGFTGVLSATDTDVQVALETLDAGVLKNTTDTLTGDLTVTAEISTLDLIVTSLSDGIVPYHKDATDGMVDSPISVSGTNVVMDNYLTLNGGVLTLSGVQPFMKLLDTTALAKSPYLVANSDIFYINFDTQSATGKVLWLDEFGNLDVTGDITAPTLIATDLSTSYMPYVDSGGALADSIISQSGSAITLTGTLNVTSDTDIGGDLEVGGLAGTGSRMVVADASGLLSATTIPSGDVTKVGTPVNNQLGVWTGDGTIEGDSGLTWDGSELYTIGDIESFGTITSSDIITGTGLVASVDDLNTQLNIKRTGTGTGSYWLYANTDEFFIAPDSGGSPGSAVFKLNNAGKLIVTNLSTTVMTDGYIPYHYSDASGFINSKIYNHTNGISINTITYTDAIINTYSSSNASMQFVKDTTLTSTAYLEFRRLRSGGTIGNNDDIMSIRGYGHDGTDLDTLSAEIVFKTTGTIATGSIPTYIDFRTMNAAGSFSSRLKITEEGIIRSAPTYANTDASSANMYIDANGDFHRSTASTIRVKENVIDWDKSGLDIISKLQTREFNYKEGYYAHPERKFLGLIAEEVVEIDPMLVDFANQDGSGQVENVRYANIVVPLIKAIQEQQKQIDYLKDSIKKLKQ